MTRPERAEGDWSWEFEPEFRAALEGPVAQLLRGDPPMQAQRLKRTRVREVWRVEDGDDAYYVKRYLSPGWAIGLRARVRGSKARREAATADALTSRGIATVRPLAVGEQRGPGLRFESILVTAAIGHRGDLVHALVADAPRAERRRLLSQIGRYLAKLHDAGVDPPDLHGENLLRSEPDGVLALIDVDGVQLGPPLSRPRREGALARTLHSLRDVTARSDRARILRSYFDFASVPVHARSDWRDAVDREWTRTRRRVLRSGSRRPVRVGSRFDQECTDERNLFWRKSVGRELAQRTIDAHAETVQSGQGIFLKRSPRVQITLQEIEGAATRFVVKETLEAGLGERWTNALLGSRSRRAWIGGHALALRGFATPETVALEERKPGRLVAENLLVTVALDGWQSLTDHFEQLYLSHELSSQEIRAKRALLRLLGRTLRRLHDERIHHHDLSARNLFVSETGEPREVAILDLESLRAFPPLTRARRATHLAQVLETVGIGHWSDTAHLLRAYGIRDARERRRWERRLQRAARRRAQRREVRRIRRYGGVTGPVVPS